MDKKLEQLRNEYKNVPIPKELDEVVLKALKPSKSRYTNKWMLGAAAAAVIFIGGLNTNQTFAKTMSDIPVVGSVIKVFTFKEWKVDDQTYNANIKTPGIENLEDKNLENSLNQKYLEENQKLYDEFMEEVAILKEQGGGHLGVDSGYVVKTDDEQILSIGRYVENTVGSSSTTFKYDIIDKEKQVLITLPSLFKDDSYIELISNNIQEQMRSQMKADPDKTYWVSGTGDQSVMPDEIFKEISADQSFYINKEHKLVISFDKYEVAPGYMGVVEFVIPTEVLANVLVGEAYIQ